MKKRTKRLLAMLLASAMILQQGSTVGVLATESEPASETVAETTAATEAQTKKPEAKTPETQAPETKAPETQAPETKASETAAPETQASETIASGTQATEAATSAAQTETATSETTETAAETTEKATDAQTAASETDEAKAGAEAGEKEAEEKATETEDPKTNFTYEDNRVKITAVAQEAAKLPQDAQIHADYMQPGTPEYQAAATTLEAAYAGKDVVLNYVFYDIYFTAASAGNGRIEPEAGTVTVSIQFKQPELKPEADAEVQTYDVVHVENGKAQEVPSTVQTTGDGSVASVSFTSSDFSPYAVVSVGAQKTEEEEPNDIDLSLGADEYGIMPVDITPSSSLNDFLHSAELSGGTGDDWTLHPGSQYKFRFEFKEVPGGRQFDMNGELTYTLPEEAKSILGLMPQEDMHGVLRGQKADGTEYEVPFTYKVVGDQIIVEFDKEDSDYADLARASNAEIYVEFWATVKEDAKGGTVNFGSEVNKEVTIDNTAKLDVKKEGSYDSKTGKITYTVTVTSTGTSKNVEIKDEITGNLLTYDEGSLKVESDKRETVDGKLTENLDGKGFTYTVPSMNDGETLTLTYTASVDYSKLDGDTFKEGDTTNTVTAEGNPGDKNEAKSSFEHTAAYQVNPDKKGTLNGEVTGGKQIIDWTIDVNQDCKVPVGGKPVKDTIEQNPYAPMEYCGEGITVQRYDADGNPVGDPVKVSWDELKVTKGSNGWTYNLPMDDQMKDKEIPYHYQITYQTSVDVLKTVDDETVKNTVDFGDKGHGSGQVTVGHQNEFGVKKNHTQPKIEGDVWTVDWTVEVDVPKSGFNESFEVEDVLPYTWGSDGVIADAYKEGSLKVTYNGVEVPSADYTLRYTAPSQYSGGKLTITFSEENVKKYFGTLGENAKLVLTYTTLPNKDYPEGELHTNTVTVKADGKSRSTSDSFTIVEPKINKKLVSNTDTVDGLPAFTFEIYLEGVSSTEVEVKDLFDTELFELVTSERGGDEHTIPRVGAGDYTWDASNRAGGWSGVGIGEDGEVSWENITEGDETGKGVIFTVKPKTKENGAYYSVYCIRYMLRVKNEEALKKLKAEAVAAGGTYKVDNTAKFGTGESLASADYTIKPVDKTILEEPKAENNYVVTFRVTINEDQLKLNAGEKLTITDHLSDSLSLLTDSIDVEIDGKKANSTDFSYDFTPDKKTLTLTIPDEKKVVITYQAKVMGTGHVTYENEVLLEGKYSDSVDNASVEIGTAAGGTASQIGFKLIKRDADERTKTLPGAEFQLYELTKSGTFEPVKTVAHEKDGKKIPGEEDVFFITGEDGSVMLDGSMSEDGWELLDGHTYQLVETKAPEGYAVDLTPIEFVAKQYATKEGEYSSGGQMDVYNTKPDVIPATAQFEITKKTVKGNADITPPPSIFKFAVEAYRPITAPLPSVREVINKAESVTFDKISYTATGEYIYKITETGYSEEATEDQKSAWPLSDEVIYVKVIVTEDTEASTLKETLQAEVKYYSDPACTKELAEGSRVITNHYASGGLKVTKTVEGDEKYKEDEFTFTIKLMREGSEGTEEVAEDINGTFGKYGTEKAEGGYEDEAPEVKFENGVATFTLKHGQSATVSGLPAGLKYKVEETGADGYVVTKTGDTGEITAGETAVAAFTNTRNSTEAELKVRKIYKGEFTGEEGEYTFNLTAGKNTAKGSIATPMPEGSEGSSKKIEITKGTGDSSDQTFGKIKYESDGTYYYTIEEEDASESSVVCDKTKYDIKVEVSTNPSTGEKIAKVFSRVAQEDVNPDVNTDTNAYGPVPNAYTVSFTNIKVAPGHAYLLVKKSFDGEFPQDEYAFRFTLTGKDGALMPGDSSGNTKTVEVTSADAVSFGDIIYEYQAEYQNQSKEYLYEIREDVTNLKGDIQYDTAVYEVKVTVGYSTGAESMTVSVQSRKKDTPEAEWTGDYSGSGQTFTASFVNTTKGKEPAELKLKGTKTLNSETEELPPFTFKLSYLSGPGWEYVTDGSGALTTNQETKNDENGNFSFDNITFKKDGTYQLLVEEVPGKDKNILYDKKKYVVVVTVGTDYSDPHNLKYVVTEVTVDGAQAIKDESATEIATYSLTKATTFDNKSVRVSKFDKETGAFLKGAKLQIRDRNTGQIVATWVTGEEPYDVTRYLKVGGAYSLEEAEAPVGYAIADPIDFILDSNGNILVNGSKVAGNLLKMGDAKLKFTVNKVDATTTSKELDGAELQVLDKNGKVVDSWTSKAGETHDFGGKLKAGESYTLREKVAPDGYACMKDWRFKVNDDGTISSLDGDGLETEIKDGQTVYLVKDSLNELSIEKIDESENALAGAKLVIKDASGNVAKDASGKNLVWTTNGGAHKITGLAPGSYTLSELEAPAGYDIAPDKTFEITGEEKFGTVIEIEMTDPKLESTPCSLRVTKELSMEGISSEAHIIVKSATYYVALFADADRTERVSDVKKIVFTNQESSYATFKNLKAGKTYYIGETDEYGTLIPSRRLENLIYYPTYDDNSTFTFEGDTTEGLAGFTNVYIEWPDYFYLSGQLTVTKQVLLDGEEYDSDDTFYARIFNDAGLTDPVSDEVLVLDMAGGSRTSVTVTNLPIGDKPGSSRKYYVTETDEYGNPLDPDEVTEYTISVDKSEITLDASSGTPEVVITNDFHEEESEFESESEVDEKKTAPKTGEDTDYAKYLFLLTLSAGTCAVLFEEKRRRNRAER